MAEVILGTGIWYFADPTKGRPVYNGSIYVGVADENPKILANRVSVTLLQEDGTKITLAPSAQPFETGAGGQILYQGSPAVIKVTDVVSVRVDNQAGFQVNYNPRYNELDAAELSLNEGSKPVNGSFEVENGTGIPANWSLVVTSGSITVDTTESAHGVKSLRFSGINSTGAGTATSDQFNVTEGGKIDVRFTYRSTAATTLNEVKIQYFDINNAPVAVDTIHTDSSTNPSSYTPFIYRSTAPSTAVKASLLIDGVNSGGSTTIASTYFDGFYIDYLTGTETVGEDGTVIDITDTPNSVSGLVVASATTGNNPTIDVGGEDVGVDIEGVTLKNGVVTGDLTGSVTGNLTGDVTANAVIADTIDVDAITARTANADLNINSNGTGVVRIDSRVLTLPIFLGSPIYIVNSSSLKGAWSTVTDALLVDAKTAIIRVSGLDTGTAAESNQVFIRRTSSGDAVGDITRALHYIGNTFSINAGSVNDLHIALDSSGQFDWQQTSVATTVTTTIMLIGYYV